MKRLLREILFTCILSCILLFGISAGAYEYAWFPAPALDVTQLPYESASHGNCNALDILPHGRAFAPFTGVIKQIDRSWGFVLFQSCKKVHYANGKLDYMTIGLLHDENIKTLKVGQIIKQGTAFYDAGGQGQLPNGSYGHYCSNHIDMSVLKGKVGSVTRYGRGDVYAYNAFYINPAKTKSIINKGKKAPYTVITNGATGNWSTKWKTLPKTTTTTTAPSSTTISSVKNNIPKAFTVVWKRNSNVSGYQIKIATNSSFTSGCDTLKIKGNSTLEAVFSAVKGKTYYVKIRTYKGSAYSKWSAVKSIKITR